ncbi:MAG TPA: hypothetical protein PKE47_12235 [Verrucomicrobiota bacterium]|nr:hypothetical protein [Verrucomicrobiota bacterium]
MNLKAPFMLLLLAAVFALGTACFGPSSRPDPQAPAGAATGTTNAVPAVR